jgi:hypothetical protein
MSAVRRSSELTENWGRSAIGTSLAASSAASKKIRRSK